jgi:hypothetical protein
MRDFETSIFGSITYGPSPKNMTPLDLVEELKQMANFLWKLKAAENWEGSEILVLPRPAIPLTPLARPFRRNVAPQVKANLGTETTLPGLDPSVDWMETTSWASSPLVAVRVTVLSGRRLHV